jgi:hypothetical protein
MKARLLRAFDLVYAGDAALAGRLTQDWEDLGPPLKAMARLAPALIAPIATPVPK